MSGIGDGSDLDPARAASLGQLVRCLHYLRARAGNPSMRDLEARTRHVGGNLSGSDLKRVPLGRNAISEMLSGRKFPDRKSFYLTFVEACGVDPAADRRWEQAWDRLYRERRLRTADGAAEPGPSWNVFDPDVIGRRLETAPRFPMRALTEMRQAIEPQAAFLAAERASAGLCTDLVKLSSRLQELGEDDGFDQDDEIGERVRDDYRNADARFHRTLLKGSQNEMFDALADAIEIALNFRIQSEYEGTLGPGPGAGGNQRFPKRPARLALWLHRGLAAAVEQGRPSAAEAFSRAILAEINLGPLPLLTRISLAHALDQLDVRCMGAAREQFEDTIRAAAGKTTASSS